MIGDALDDEECAMSLTISVFSDVICPWCYVGKRRLERALDQLGQRETTAIEWLPFELNPTMPAEGMERALYRARKFGAERSAQLDAQMAELGRQEGIDFAFDRMTRTPSTRRAHMLIAAASQHGRADPVVDALFRAYFEEGRDVGDLDVLREIGVASGLDRAVVDDALGNEQLRQLVEAVERQAAEMQVSGVPFFIVDRKWAVSGAQPTEQWVGALQDQLDG
ncbi:DsbA family oxidoreductase [Methylobacterium ajmalii]|uniref:DsbA family oxidoreductase n=1 Tax=Methylobacterium ajmalii TaxID=2738439 RepID=A0ABU9ZRR0_9HYPH